MATFHIQHFGCRATQADAAAIERQLLERGFAHADDGWRDALSDNYLKVRVTGAWPANTMLDVRITADAATHLLAETA
jgi:hypothetical protein